MNAKVIDRSRWEELTIKAFNATARDDAARRGPGFEFFVDEVFARVMSQMPMDPNVLDLGCGFGRLIPVLEACGVQRIVGIDASSECIRIMKERYPKHDFRVGNILSLKETLDKALFDGFFAMTSLMHILPEHMPQAARSIREVVRTGAIGFISTPHGSEEALLSKDSSDMNGAVIPEGHYIFRALWNPERFIECFTREGFSLGNPSLINGRMLEITVKAI